VPPEPPHAAEPSSNDSAPTTTKGGRRPVRCSGFSAIYLLLRGTSSTMVMQNPWGLTLVAFFTMVIFIVVS
jgi:hypothetical protein